MGYTHRFYGTPATNNISHLPPSQGYLMRMVGVDDTHVADGGYWAVMPQYVGKIQARKQMKDTFTSLLAHITHLLTYLSIRVIFLISCS